jgi:hypothetical protein
VSGYDSEASGFASFATGEGSDAAGYASLASGSSTTSGEYSVSIGLSNLSSGRASAAFGNETTASGQYTFTAGRRVEAPSYAESVFGVFNALYTPSSTTGFDGGDRIFSIGNGINNGNRSNALTVLKNGFIGIGNDALTPTHLLHLDNGQDDPLRISNLTSGDTLTQILVQDSSGVIHTRDLSTIRYDAITDEDADTRIQAEESPDEDILRFDVAGTEVLTITDSVSTFRGTGRDLLKIKTFNNNVEAGLAFQNVGSSYTWSIHRSAEGVPDLVFSGGNTPVNVDDLIERLRITKAGLVKVAGDLDVGNTISTAGLQLSDGSEAEGKLLISDVDGIATWVDPNTGLSLPDTAMPIPIKYHAGYLFVHPMDNGTEVTWDSAQVVCNDLSAFGFDDWYLPTLGELNAMYKQSYLITGLDESIAVKYWSNTEFDTEMAYTQRLDYGGPDPDAKSDFEEHRCRCVRND